jgi:hypothetical protein
VLEQIWPEATVVGSLRSISLFFSGQTAQH